MMTIPTNNEASFTKEAGWEPLPGYRLIEPLGMGGFGEVWKCEVPGGLFKAIKFVHGNLESLDPETSAQQELAAFKRIKEVRHPFVLSLERVEIVDGELIMVMELADKNLEDRLWECQQQEGLPGIPRNQLLPLLMDAAEALDLLNCDFGLQHLDIKPSNLFIVGQHVKLADFGLVQSLEELQSANSGQVQCGLTPLYSPPEMLQGKGSRHCDQYSLGIVYQYALTGVLPFDGKNPRQLMMQHISTEPNLQSLCEEDRAIVARALAKNPEERFPSCLDLVHALVSVQELRVSHSKDSEKSSRIFIAPLRSVNHSANRNNLTPPPAAPDGSVGRPKSNSAQPPSGESLKHTLGNSSANSDTSRRASPTSVAFNAPTESLAIPGYKTEECVLKSALGEMWNVRSAKEKLALAWRLHLGQTTKDNLSENWQRLLEIDHDTIPILKRPNGAGDGIVLFDTNEPLLWERFQHCLAKGRPGIPRRELITYLARTATALDELAESVNLHHWNLNPYSLLITKSQIYFTDFGLVPLIRMKTGLSVQDVNRRYAAPEMFQNAPAKTSDQYSLALIYIEMLTGVHPRPKISVRGDQARMKIDLTLLPATEQRAIRKALDHDPKKRFASCQAFLEALGVSFRHRPSTAANLRLRPLVPAATLDRYVWPTKDASEIVEEYMRDILRVEAKLLRYVETKNCQFVELKNSRYETNVPVHLLRDTANLKVKSLGRLWDAEVTKTDSNSLHFHLPLKKTGWAQFLQKERGIEVTLQFDPNKPETVMFSGASVLITPYGNVDDAVLEYWHLSSPELFDQLCGALEITAENRKHIRLPFDKPVQVHTILPEQKMGPVLTGRSINLSEGGIRVSLPEELSCSYVYLHWPQIGPINHREPLAVLAKKVWERKNEEEDYEVGLRFLQHSVSHTELNN